MAGADTRPIGLVVTHYCTPLFLLRGKVYGRPPRPNAFPARNVDRGLGARRCHRPRQQNALEGGGDQSIGLKLAPSCGLHLAQEELMNRRRLAAQLRNVR